MPAVVVSGGRAHLVAGPVGALLWPAGIAMPVAAVLPQMRARRGAAARPRWEAPGPSLASLLGRAGPEELLPAVVVAGWDPGRWLLGQACGLGAILAAKYRWMRCGVLFLLVGGAVAAVGGLW